MAGKCVAMILHCPVWWCGVEWRRGGRDSFLQIDGKFPKEFKLNKINQLNGLILIMFQLYWVPAICQMTDKLQARAVFRVVDLFLFFEFSPVGSPSFGLCAVATPHILCQFASRLEPRTTIAFTLFTGVSQVRRQKESGKKLASEIKYRPQGPGILTAGLMHNLFQKIKTCPMNFYERFYKYAASWWST